MDAVIFNLATGNSRLLIQIILILTVNEVDDWLPARERGEGERERGGEGIKLNRDTPYIISPDNYCHFLVYLAPFVSMPNDLYLTSTPSPLRPYSYRVHGASLFLFLSLSLSFSHTCLLLYHASYSHQLLLSTTSPNPGVSTTVNSNRTPPSWILIVDARTCQGEKTKHYINFQLKIHFEQ